MNKNQKWLSKSDNIYLCLQFVQHRTFFKSFTYFGLESNSTKNGGISIHLAISRILNILLQPPKSLTPNKTNGPLNQQNSFLTETTHHLGYQPNPRCVSCSVVCKLGKYTYEEFLYISFTSTQILNPKAKIKSGWPNRRHQCSKKEKKKSAINAAGVKKLYPFDLQHHKCLLEYQSSAQKLNFFLDFCAHYALHSITEAQRAHTFP